MKSDYLIIGGGIVGLSIAIELKRRFKDSRIILIEKEATCGFHASGRNSGVLHAGFYYSADSLKARLTADGNRLMTGFCEERGLKISKCGKLVVAQDESELPWLDELLLRARNNGVVLENITAKQAKEIEPRVKTFERALFSPDTSTVDPQEVIREIVRCARKLGIEVQAETRFLRARKNKIETSRGIYETGYLVNAGGLYADQIALEFGFSENYRILPFKGLYLYGGEGAGMLNTNIYPVPNLKNPFLGTHFTLTVNQKIKIGPTAIPAFWREQYGGIENFNMYEIADIVMRQAGLIAFSGFDFKRLAFEEMQKYSRKKLVSLSSRLLEGVDPDHYRQWGKPGIRAQLLNVKEKKLEMDFVIEGDDRSIHILNAVSPAFTCAIPFSAYVCDRIASYRPH